MNKIESYGKNSTKSDEYVEYEDFEYFEKKMIELKAFWTTYRQTRIYLNLIRLMFGIFSIVATTITGAAIFSGISSDNPQAYYALGGLSIGAAALTSILTFLDPKKRVERLAIAINGYKELYQELDDLLRKHVTLDISKYEFMEEAEAIIVKERTLSADIPDVIPGIYKGYFARFYFRTERLHSKRFAIKLGLTEIEYP